MGMPITDDFADPNSLYQPNH